jgi:hypothetical protein
MTQWDGLAMGAPSSGLIAEIFLQHTENTHLPSLAQKHKIVNYIRYVDDLLLIYNSTHTDIHDIFTDFNAIHHNLHFTAETETNNTLNYLDVSIHRSPDSLTTSIYRKPTFTDTIIPYTSNHPPTTQIRRHQVSLQQTTLLQSRRNRAQTRTQHHPQHYAEQLILCRTTQTTNQTHEMTTGDAPLETKMGHIHIHRERNTLHYKYIQAH